MLNELQKQLWKNIKVINIKNNIAIIGSDIKRSSYLEYGKKEKIC